MCIYLNFPQGTGELVNTAGMCFLSQSDQMKGDLTAGRSHCWCWKSLWQEGLPRTASALLGKATSVVVLMSHAPPLHKPTQPMLLFWLQLVDVTLEYLRYLQYHRQQEIKEMIGLGE